MKANNIDVLRWIAEREQPSLYGHTHRRDKPTRTLTSDIMIYLGLSRAAVQKLMARHVATGAVIVCTIQRPGLPDEHEYRIGNGIPDGFRPLPASPDALRRLSVREPVRAHVPQIKPAQRQSAADLSRLSRPERACRHLQENGPTFAYALARIIGVAHGDVRDCMRGLVNAGRVGLRQKLDGTRLRNQYYIPAPQEVPELPGGKAAPGERQRLALSVLRAHGPMLSMPLANAVGLLTSNNIGQVMWPLQKAGTVGVRKVPSEVGPPANEYFLIPQPASAPGDQAQVSLDNSAADAPAVPPFTTGRDSLPAVPSCKPAPTGQQLGEQVRRRALTHTPTLEQRT